MGKDTVTKSIGYLIQISILVVLVLVLLNKCEKPAVFSNTVTHTSSYVDTIPFYNNKDSIIVTNIQIIGYTPNPVDSTVRDYTTTFDDSLITGKIVSSVARDGVMLSQKFKYVPKFPKYIIRTDSIFVTTTNETIKEVYKPTWGLYAGSVIGLDQGKFTLVPQVHLKLKNESIITVGYNPFTKATYVGGALRIIGSKRK